MGIALIVTRSYDENLQETGNEIALIDWLNLVEHDGELRLRAEPFVATNPTTNERITIDALSGQTEFAVGNQFIPFLGHRRGELVMRFSPAFDDENHPVRRKVAEVARRLGAIITHDAGDEVLRW
jgi:hypothetical protein